MGSFVCQELLEIVVVSLWQVLRQVAMLLVLASALADSNSVLYFVSLSKMAWKAELGWC